jgi:hypothetical protein
MHFPVYTRIQSEFNNFGKWATWEPIITDSNFFLHWFTVQQQINQFRKQNIITINKKKPWATMRSCWFFFSKKSIEAQKPRGSHISDPLADLCKLMQQLDTNPWSLGHHGQSWTYKSPKNICCVLAYLILYKDRGPLATAGHTGSLELYYPIRWVLYCSFASLVMSTVPEPLSYIRRTRGIFCQDDPHKPQH